VIRRNENVEKQKKNYDKEGMKRKRNRRKR